MGGGDSEPPHLSLLVITRLSTKPVTALSTMFLSGLAVSLALLVSVSGQLVPCDERPGWLRCGDGRCVSVSELCDGREDCEAGEDEDSDNEEDRVVRPHSDLKEQENGLKGASSVGEKSLVVSLPTPPLFSGSFNNFWLAL